MIKDERVEILEKSAKEILNLKHSLGSRRPLIIEFCGTPKAGKTTTINSLNIFLKRNDFKTSVIGEMASICPISKKTNYFFNSWTIFQSLSDTIKILSNEDTKIDIVLIDRSVFDAICWFKWLSLNPKKNPLLSDSQYKSFESFLVESDIWTRYIDLVYIFKTSPEAALKREFSELLTRKSGTIMNLEVLKSYNEAIEHIKNNKGSRFRRIEEYNTTNENPNIVSFDITTKVLEVLKELLTERIGYFLETFSINLNTGINSYDIIANRILFYGDRTIIEKENYIQPIPIAIITDEERKHVLVVKKNDQKVEKNSPEYNRMLIYIGGHVRQEDNILGNSGITDNLTILKRALEREIKEEINENISIGNDTPFLIYTPINEKSKKHIAVCFIIEMNLIHKKFIPTKEEFIQKNQNSKSGTIIKIRELAEMYNEFEPWSQNIINHIFKINLTLFS